MADVFISYKRDERVLVEQLAAALRDLGLTIWFDAGISAGENFTDEVDREARAAGVILVCWSPTARDSQWVRAEAMIGFEQDKLATVYLTGPDNFSPPTPFNSVHMEDLRSWFSAPSNANASWRSLLRRIGKLCRRSEIEHLGNLTGSADRLDSAERRHLTLMHVSLADPSSKPIERDPEELRESSVAAHTCIQREISSLEGYVARTSSDAVLAYFGWPLAHENDAERAVRVGLQLQKVLCKIQPINGFALGARIGIASGWVVLGDLAGQQNEVVGETATLAVRLQAMAEIGEVVVSQHTLDLLGDTFAYESMKPLAPDGSSASTPAFRVVSPSQESRFDAKAAKGLKRFVGRDAEQSVLLQHWSQARDGEGQVVILSGEAGVGKSRTVRNFMEAITGPSVRLRYQCSPFHQNSSLHPLIAQIEAAAGFVRDDGTDVRYQKCDALLRRTGADAQLVDLVAELLSLPVASEIRLTPSEKKQRLFGGLLRQIEELAKTEPVLVVFEDLHWMDPSTSDYLECAIDTVRDLPVLALLTARSEFKTPPSWSLRQHVSRHELGRMRNRDVAELAESVAGAALPQEVIQHIVDKTDGIPLFVEELTKAVLEQGLMERKGDRFVLRGRLPARAVPGTLQDSLMARLDRIPAAKSVAQIGAALGRSFSHDLIAAVAPLNGPALANALDQLIAAELLFRRAAPAADVSYTFKHALVQDAAYAAMLQAQRKVLHRNIAQALEAKFPALRESEPETLAHHWMNAVVPEQAIDYWLKAGQRAGARSANVEALSHLKKGIDALTHVAKSATRNLLDFKLHLAFGQASYVAHGPAAPLTTEAYQRALAMIEAIDDANHRYALLYGIFAGFHFASRFESAESPARLVLSLATKERDAGHLCQAHRMLGYLRFFQGDLTGALGHFRKLAKIYIPEKHGEIAFRYGADSRVSVNGFETVVHALVGEPDRAVELGEANLTYGRKLGHPASLGWAFASLGYLNFYLRRYADARTITTEAVKYCEANNVAVWGLHSRVFNAWARVHLGDGQLEQHLTEMRQAIIDAGTRIALGQPLLRGCLAEGLLLAGRSAEALEVIDLARDGLSGQRIFEPTVLSIRAQCLLALPNADEAGAEASLRRALESSDKMGANLLTLRFATHLATLSRPRREARKRVAKLLKQIAGGSELEDVRAARACVS